MPLQLVAHSRRIHRPAPAWEGEKSSEGQFENPLSSIHHMANLRESVSLYRSKW